MKAKEEGTKKFRAFFFILCVFVVEKGFKKVWKHNGHDDHNGV